MSPLSRFRHVRNPLTLFGIWLTTVSAILFLVVFFADLFNLVHNPYLGILFFIVLPTFFVIGLLMMPLGIYFSRRGEKRGGVPANGVACGPRSRHDGHRASPGQAASQAHTP